MAETAKFNSQNGKQCICELPPGGLNGTLLLGRWKPLLVTTELYC